MQDVLSVKSSLKQSFILVLPIYSLCKTKQNIMCHHVPSVSMVMSVRAVDRQRRPVTHRVQHTQTWRQGRHARCWRSVAVPYICYCYSFLARSPPRFDFTMTRDSCYHRTGVSPQCVHTWSMQKVASCAWREKSGRLHPRTSIAFGGMLLDHPCQRFMEG